MATPLTALVLRRLGLVRLEPAQQDMLLIRLDPGEEDLLRRAAALFDSDPSAFAREAIVRRAKAVTELNRRQEEDRDAADAAFDAFMGGRRAAWQ
ncbi:MAG TPA: DUF1778 domain-containing protein [Acidimicrobiales bacterium]|nr:DUF1778 domain-containing protein [Acidimicrobiales bacterium]